MVTIIINAYVGIDTNMIAVNANTNVDMKNAAHILLPHKKRFLASAPTDLTQRPLGPRGNPTRTRPDAYAVSSVMGRLKGIAPALRLIHLLQRSH